MWDNYFAEAGEDSAATVRAMESDVLLFSGESILLERDLKKAIARGDRYENWYEGERGSWLDRIWKSDFIKWGSFVLGVWFGAYAAS